MNENLIHKMHLYPEPFEKVLSGVKTIEYRLYDAKRRKITLGDTIEFQQSEDPCRTVQVKVIGYLCYSTFRALFESLTPAQGGPESDQLDEWVDCMRSIYSKENEDKWGVVGILIYKMD